MLQGLVAVVVFLTLVVLALLAWLAGTEVCPSFTL